MAVKLAPNVIPTHDANGDPYNGALLFTYQAGSSTKLATYTDSTGNTAQANPIVLNSKGMPNNYPWLTEGQTYKFVLAPSTDTDPPASPILTVDNISGINDANLTIDQWVSSGLTPTYVSATQFTLSGDQTSEFVVGRRLKTTNSGGTVYSIITASAYTSLTTVTVVNDSGSLDAGLSVVAYGILTPNNPSIPKAALPDGMTATTQSASDNSTKIATTAYADTAATNATTGEFVSVSNIADGTAFKVLGWGSDGEAAEVDQGMRVIYAADLTATANVDLNFTSLDATQDADNVYLIRIINFQPGTDQAGLQLRLSSDAGSNFSAGASDYQWSRTGQTVGGSLSTSDNADSEIEIAGVAATANGLSSASNEVATVDIKISGFNTGASVIPIIRADCGYIDAGSAACVTSVMGAPVAAADYDAIRLLWSSGNWAAVGRIIVFKYGNA